MEEEPTTECEHATAQHQLMVEGIVLVTAQNLLAAIMKAVQVSLFELFHFEEVFFNK